MKKAYKRPVITEGISLAAISAIGSNSVGWPKAFPDVERGSVVYCLTHEKKATFLCRPERRGKLWKKVTSSRS